MVMPKKAKVKYFLEGKILSEKKDNFLKRKVA